MSEPNKPSGEPTKNPGDWALRAVVTLVMVIMLITTTIQIGQGRPSLELASLTGALIGLVTLLWKGKQ